MRDASCVQRGEAVSKHAPAANPFGVCRYCPLPVLHGSTSGQIPSPRLLPPSARQRASLRSSHSISSPAAFGRQQTPCPVDGGTSPQGFGEQVPGPLLNPPS